MVNDSEHRSRGALLTMWIETVVVSYLIGEPPPAPAPAVADAFAGDDDRSRRCTLVHAVERAVAARWSHLTCWFDPHDFAEHVLRTAEAHLAGASADDPNWLRWTAGFFRWVLVRDALRRAVAAGHGGGPPHPRTAEWALMGLPLDGVTQSNQLTQLLAHPTYGDGQQQFVLGDAARSGLLAAVHELSGTTGDEGIGRALDRSCRGQRYDLVVPRMGVLMRKADAERPGGAR